VPPVLEVPYRFRSEEATRPETMFDPSEILRDRDDLAGARSKHETVLHFLSRNRDAAGAAAEQMSLARMYLDEGHAADAARLAREAAVEFETQKRSDDEALAQALLAKALAAHGQNQEARAARERAARLESKSQALLTRLQVEIAEADADAVLAQRGRSASASEIRRLPEIANEAHAHGIRSLEFEAQLVHGEWEGPCVTPGAGRALRVLQREASAKGFLLVASRAARFCGQASRETGSGHL